MGPAGPLLRLPVLGQVVHDTARDPPQPPKRQVDRAVLGDRQRCSPITKTYGKSAGMLWGRWDHFCDIRFLSVSLGQVVHVTPQRAQTPKRRVDRAVLGACQRCSPLTQTYGKSAGMVWGRRDHLCYIWFLSVHIGFAPAATSGARFCSELVGSRKDALHSNFDTVGSGQGFKVCRV